ncbi:MAG: 30S ribosomal protein S27ae [Candidatus Nanoarchaeia archaeon]
MADKKEKKGGKPIRKSGYYKVSGDKVERARKNCPKCGPAVFMGEHKDRFACGKCGYMERKVAK